MLLDHVFLTCTISDTNGRKEDVQHNKHSKQSRLIRFECQENKHVHKVRNMYYACPCTTATMLGEMGTEF